MLFRSVADKEINKLDDETLILADMSRKAVQQVKNTVKRIACCTYSEETAEKLADELASGRWTHDYPIGVEEALSLGLKISTDVPEEIYQLMNLFPQTSQRRPSVEYVPAPYHYRPDEIKRKGSG